MAIRKLSGSWNGVQRTSSNCTIETCYSVYGDMDDQTQDAYLCVNGLSIYSDNVSNLSSFIEGSEIMFTISDIENESEDELGTYSIDIDVKSGAYSPSGIWMPHFVMLFSTDQFHIPHNGDEFLIHVYIIRNNTELLSFTEHCCGVYANTVTPPENMVTGRVYSFLPQRQFLAGESFQTKSSLTWHPTVIGTYTTTVVDTGYVDAGTSTDAATSNFSTLYFAVANPDHLYDSGSSIVNDASIVLQTRYLTDDFTGGILITDISLSVEVTARNEVDASLKPVLTASGISISGSPELGILNGKYVHKQCTLTFTPVATYQFGDSLSYIQTSDGKNRYSASVSYVASGVAPGTEYIRPDTGTTVVADEESVCGTTIRVVGNKWGLQSDYATAIYTVLYYHMPRLEEFSVHRCSVSTVPTDYEYNNTYYKKDDFGAYCMILYQVNYSDLDSENTPETELQYGTHIMVGSTINGVTHCVVVPANTEQTMDVIITLYDAFYLYGVSSQLRLSTANVLIDFLAGGKGMAIGKTATVQNALDISSNYKLLFYNALVGAYQGNNQIDLVPWMHGVDERLTHLENSPYAN